ncbi:MAG TPA: hypothetical protein VFH56_14030 [Acidimicrobiales bacterium]|nr:hypothetical protein [Acidimicrobiales bacterium]
MAPWRIGEASAWHPVTVAGGRSTSAKHLHFKARPQRRLPLRRLLVLLAALVLLGTAVAARAATEPVGGLTVKTIVPTTVLLSGSSPPVAWPARGEAAVEVQGLAPLGSSGAATPLPIASLAKIMTAYVLLQDHPLSGGSGFTLTVSASDVTAFKTAVAEQQSVVAVAPGETLSEVQLLQALLVASGNNIATTIADYDAGSVPAFVSKMNAAAKSLGMDHTSYTDPSGVSSATVSTASDQLLLTDKAMHNSAFAQIVALPSVDLPVEGKVPNFNHAVGTGGYIGVKTGSTVLAGGCLAFANRQSVAGREVTILGVVLGQGLGQSGTAALNAAALKAASGLIASITSGLTSRTVLPAGSVVAVVTNASGSKVPATIPTAITTVGFGGTRVPVSVDVRRLGHNLSAGETVASVSLGTDPAGSVPVLAESGMPSPSWSWRLLHLF